MRIDIKRINDAVNLEATNDTGVKLLMDGSDAIGGKNLGMRPMQILLASLGGCSSMDVLSILKKMQQDVTEYQVVLNGNREEGVEPSLFKTIDVKFILKGNNLDANRVERAIELSMTKYCSVAKTLEPTCSITSSFEIL
ncbi:MAG: OsmC family peroxiredoxin [Bacteroidetes bacterium]|nr:MAG: OsmC family peroxiredoxin [Bacteroidota bacterium]